jgi:hypothetical protein
MRKPDTQFNTDWNALMQRLEGRFGQDLSLEGILLLIGIQEIGQGPLKLTKLQKLEVLHVAVCSLLLPYGYYVFKGRDEEGWPHFEPVDTMPFLSSVQQHRLIKEAILSYFSDRLEVAEED